MTVSPPVPPAPAPPAKTIVTVPRTDPYGGCIAELYGRSASAGLRSGSRGFDPGAAAAIGRETGRYRAAEVERVLQTEPDATSDSPIGDWQTEGKGTVRIGKCGDALCGFVIAASDERGEAILINMKPKTERQWTGGVYSQSSGETYYGTIVDEGHQHASRRGLRGRPLLLRGQQLEPHRAPRRRRDDVASNARSRALMTTRENAR